MVATMRETELLASRPARDTATFTLADAQSVTATGIRIQDHARDSESCAPVRPPRSRHSTPR